MPGFNLIDEPWIPCSVPAGGQQAYGLHGVLAAAHEIGEIDDPSPLVTIALYRLLLAVLHRVFGPEAHGDWEALWSAGRFDAARLDGYLAQWHDRFGLFDERHPFYQTPGLDLSTAGPVAKLTHELASGNNVTLFDHTTEARPASFTAAQAARYLVAHQAFAVGGLVSYDLKEHKSATAAPLVKMAVGLVRGRNLFQTLMLNMVRYSPGAREPFPTRGDDRPAWERDEPTVPGERPVAGYLDLLTWQSRRIRLRGEGLIDGSPAVSGVVIMKGAQFEASYQAYEHETMAAFARPEKPKPGQEAPAPIGFREDRAIWRDSLALLSLPGTGKQRPRVLDWLNELLDDGIINRAQILPLDLYGMCSDRASVLLWRHERLPLPLAYLDNKNLLDSLDTALHLAEQGGRDLNRAIRWLATLLLAPEADQEGARQPLGEDVSRLADSLGATRLYWAALDTRFQPFMIDLAEDTHDEDGVPLYGARELPLWAWGVRRTARDAFEEIARGLDTSARALKATAKAQSHLNGLLSATFNGYANQTEGDAA